MTVVPRPCPPRVVRSTTFDDLLPDGVTVSAVLSDRVEFTAELDEETVAAIRERMASRDDDDQANRAALRAAAVSGAVNLAQMLVAYTVGDPMPDAVISE